MKWYRYVHPIVFVIAFLPLVMSWVPFWAGILIALAAIVPYAINEIVLDRKEKKLATENH
jgi:hypothetical protein